MGKSWLMCVACATALFAVPAGAQQLAGGQAAADQSALPQPPPPADALPPPPPFPPMPKAKPSHRFTSGYKASRAHHSTSHRTAHHRATQHRTSHRGTEHRSTAHHRTHHASTRAKGPAATTMRSCASMTQKQMMRHKVCRAMVQAFYKAHVEKRHTTKHHARHTAAKRHRRHR